MEFHETLSVPPTATQEEIQKAYRRKVMECHPDRNPGDAEATKRFLAVQEAYEALTNPNYRPPRPGQYTQTYRTTPSQPKSSGIWDAPPPTHDIWGNPVGAQTERPKSRPRPRPAPRPIAVVEPEVDLWKSMETKAGKFSRNYWQEYNKLKRTMAYEEPDKFWEAMEEWTKKNR